MIRVNAILPIQPGIAAEFIVLARRLAEAAKTEPGCISYEVGQDVRNPDLIVLFEEWTSQDALTAHMRTPAFQELTALMVPLHGGEPEFRICTVVG